MSGSSRALLRTIVSVFENWSVNKNWDKLPSQDIKDLNDTIYAYKERHNLLSSLNSLTMSFDLPIASTSRIHWTYPKRFYSWIF